MELKEKMKLLYDNPVVAWHEHMFSKDGSYKELNTNAADAYMRIYESLGFDKVVTSLPVVEHKRCPAWKFIAANDITYQATKRYPGKVYGMGYVHPGHIFEALHEIDRCVQDLGFVGIKLYYDYFIDDPVYEPIIEKCIEYDIPILEHCMHCMDADNKIRQPFTSDGQRIANVAKRYPEATFLMGHFTISEWEYSLNAIADCPNVYTDMSGSYYDAPQIEKAVEMLGAGRILFATDNSPSSCVGKILGAKISEEDKKTILRGTAFERFIEKAGK